MKNTNKIRTAIFNMSLMLLSPLLNAEGIDLGNAGVSKEKPNGQLELVEHLANAVCPPIEDNKTFFQEVAPELTARLSQISKVDPLLALALWRDINDMHIRTCHFPLENISGCPKPAFEGEVVVGCRLSDGAQGFGNKVYLAEKDIIKSHERPEYVLLHESLHKIIPGNDQAHQQKLNEFSYYLFVNQGKLEKNTLRKILVTEMGATSYLKIPKIYSSSTPNTLIQSYEDLISLIMGGNASAESQCSLMQTSSDKALSKNPVSQLMEALVSDQYRWPLLPDNCKGMPSLRESVFKILGKNFHAYVRFLGNHRAVYVDQNAYDYDLYDCNFSVKHENVSQVRSWAWGWSGIQKTRHSVFSPTSPLTVENRTLAKIYLDFFPDSAQDLPEFESYLSYGHYAPFSAPNVDESCKGSDSKLRAILNAEKICSEKYSWDSQKKEWIEKRSIQSPAKQGNGSDKSKGNSIWKLFRK